MLEILYDQQLNCDNEAGLEIEEMSGMEKTQLKLPKENPFVMRPEEDENIPKEFLGSRRCRSLANITFVNESRPNLSSNIRASTHLGIRVKLFGLENLNLNLIIRLRSTFLNTHLKAFLNPVWRRYQVSAPVLSIFRT